MTDTPDVERFSEADVEAAAEAMYHAIGTRPVGYRNNPSEPVKDWYRILARAALTTYTGRLAEERRVLREALVEARAEIDGWGYGDFHYGNLPRDPSVLAALANIDAALGDGGA